MKLNISSNDLLKGLLDVSKAIPSKSALPILENFLFVLKDNKLEVTASDSELTLRTTIEVEGAEEGGSIAVPARHMIDLLKELPDQPVRIRTVSDSSFECSWASGNSVLPYFPADDYPEIKGTGEDAQKVEFPAASLVEGIQGTVYATADDEIRPAMNGIFFDIDTASTTLVASDSHKLICYTTTDVKAAEKASFILHKKPANVLRGILGKDVDNVVIEFDLPPGRGQVPEIPRRHPAEQRQRPQDRPHPPAEHRPPRGRVLQQGVEPYQVHPQGRPAGSVRAGSGLRPRRLREDCLRLRR